MAGNRMAAPGRGRFEHVLLKIRSSQLYQPAVR